ncbi:SDR family oxidoreductase [Rhizobiaceae bacterium]|nr:SDR family oxidoreductase [Rhizobiaceae bacterium]
MAPFSRDAFQNRTVVITGCGRGIGLAAAAAFAACGARVLAHSGRSGTAPALSGIADAVYEADFTQSAELDEFTRWVNEQTDHVDVLINNAGTMFGRFPADALKAEDYERIVALNQTAVVRVTGGLIPLLRKSANGAIINTISISAATGGSPGSSIYSATKAFVATYTKALARELAPDGIRANAVSPGTIDTEFHERYSSAEKLDAARKSIPLQRLGTAEDCAAAYLFLAHPELSGYITGQTLEINGGQLIV